MLCKGFNVFRNDRLHKRGDGVAIYVKSSNLRAFVVRRAVLRSNDNVYDRHDDSVVLVNDDIELLFVEIHVNKSSKWCLVWCIMRLVLD